MRLNILFTSGFWRHVTVEPAMFFGFFTVELLQVLNTNLYLQKTCRINATVEPDLNSPCDDEKKGILFVSSVFTSCQFGFIIIGVLFTTFAAIYSDLAGKKRKAFIILPLIGLVLESILSCSQAYFWQWPPLIGVLLTTMPYNISGGIICLVAFTNVYICDITEHKDRNMRLAISTAARVTSIPIAQGMAGYLMFKAGFFYSYLICIMVSILALVSACLFVRNTSEHNEGGKSNDGKETVDSEKPVPRKITVRDVFSLKEVIRSFKIVLCTKKSRRHKITIILLLIIDELIYTFLGEVTVMYLYVRYRFHWDAVKYSIFSSYRLSVGIIGSLLCTLIMSKLLKLHDGILGMFAGFWDTLAVVAFFFADQSWQLYIIPLFDIFHGVAFSSSCSFSSKFFNDYEFGRLRSVYQLFGILVFISIPVYNTIFQKTMDFLPNAFFLLSILANGLVCFLFGVTYVLSKDVR